MKSKSILVLVIVFLITGNAYAVLTDGLVSYYPFNGNANDATGNSHDGTVHGATLTTDRFGKMVINVTFRTEDGKLLPGGAWRLNQHTDDSIEIGYEELAKHLNIPTHAATQLIRGAKS